MSTDDTASKAIQRARAAYDQMKRRQHKAAAKQRSHERWVKIKLTVLAIILVGGGIGITVHNGWVPTSLRETTREAKVDNSKFGETRTAPIRTFVKGNTCQEMQFNNDIGAYVAGALVPCEPEKKRESVFPLLPNPNNPNKGERANAIRDSFNR